MNSVAIAPAYIHTSVKRRKNVWYSVADGLWSDPSVWVSNRTKRYSYPSQDVASPVFPQIGDDVYINHSVTVSFTNPTTITVNNLFVSGSILFGNINSVNFNVSGNVQANGTVNLSSTQIVRFYVAGTNNFINTFTSGSNSYFGYVSYWEQRVMNLSYSSLYISGYGTKFLQTNTTLGNKLYVEIAATIQLGIYDLTVTGQTYFEGGTILKPSSGALIFAGLLTTSNGGGTLNLSGNPTVECRGGIYWNSVAFTSGTGAWDFTTNSQSLVMYNTAYQFNNAVRIVGTITVSLASNATYNFGMQINTSLDGTLAGSAFVNNTGNLLLNIAGGIMLTAGTSDFSTYANYLTYVYNGNLTLQKTALSSLVLIGSGTKTLFGNTTLSGLLQIGTQAVTSTLECSTYNLTVTGSTSVGLPSTSSINGILSKTGAGSLVFIGQLNLGNGTPNVVNLSGNPTVECRGGIMATNFNGMVSGTGQWSFTINNQNIDENNTAGNSDMMFDGNVLISGAIKVTHRNTATVPIPSLLFNGTLDGNNASSEFDERAITQYKNTTIPMVTGILTTNAAANTWKYNKAGAQDVKGGTYRIIEFGGSGVKTLLGNVVVNVTGGGSQSTTGSATVNLNGFTITTI